MSRNKIIERRIALEASLETVEYQIEHLQKHYSVAQVRIWKKRRATLRRKVKEFKRAERLLQKDAKRLNYSNCAKIKRITPL